MAKRKVEWSTKAVSELKNILDFYNTRNYSSTFNKKLYDKIKKNINLISMNPQLGTKTDDANVRTFIFDNYQIIYEIGEDYILISMIWDSRRNPKNKFS
jgi:plasmid stabilization system protein ParE